jgi:glycosyltransferase involved in cell wall biosynthesis
MATDPIVSIITPTFNHERFIAQCIQSVLSQTYPHWEQIIIDDGSTDQTGEIISQYKDSRIKYIRQENKGIWRLSEAYNKALEISRGEFIAILEGDDFWPQDKLEVQIRKFTCDDTVLSWGKAKNVDINGILLGVLPKEVKSFMSLSREQVLGRLLLGNAMHSCTVICRKSALQSIGGFKQSKDMPYVDYPTWLELSLIGDFLPIDEILGCYRKHDSQISCSMNASMIKAGLYSIEFFNGLSDKVKTSLDKENGNLMANLRRKEINSYYYLGRAYLKEGNLSSAKENFLKAIFQGDPYLRAKAALGLLCSYGRIDLEKLARIHDKRDAKDR